jgi:threonine aldolase
VGDAVDTNIVIFHVDPKLGTAAEFCEKLKARGVLMLAIGAQQVRAVTHLDVDEADTAQACELLSEVAAAAPRTKVTAGADVHY